MHALTPKRWRELSRRYRKLRIAVVGDFALDRYLEIDPDRQERSLETGRSVHNVVRIRAQPGAAGTVVSNLVAAGVAKVPVVGFVGSDGEGYELRQALSSLPGVVLEGLLETSQRRTFTYSKPLVLVPGQPPIELNRLDLKNWTPTPRTVQKRLSEHVRALAGEVDAMIVLDQVPVAGTGVVSREVLQAVQDVMRREPELLVLGDCRRGLREFPPMIWKMNRRELGLLCGGKSPFSRAKVRREASQLARRNRHPVIVTLAAEGLLGAWPTGEVWEVPALPTRGPIDVVGAGDAVSAHVVAALSAGAFPEEALTAANAAAWVVIHKLGTTGTARPSEVERALRVGAHPGEG
ncbi:MAG: PfkB family carbohydrate kinase [Verrucomicrobiota bacterium]|nr:PfkB family carbohydrate kinase [Limisphaera sp.]MDW8380789.1 PfkB family carbohydrate kinase [Verrucomicrobiota bacterium]